MSHSGIEGPPIGGEELPHDELIELARILNDHVSGYRAGGARVVAAAIMRAGYRKQEPTDTLAAEVATHQQRLRDRMRPTADYYWPDPDARPTY